MNCGYNCNVAGKFGTITPILDFGVLTSMGPATTCLQNSEYINPAIFGRIIFTLFCLDPKHDESSMIIYDHDLL